MDLHTSLRNGIQTGQGGRAHGRDQDPHNFRQIERFRDDRDAVPGRDQGNSLEEPNGVVLSHALRRRETELFDSIANLIPIDAEQSRGLCLVAPRTLQRLNDETPFELLQVDASSR